jgi:hypothetical protein
MVVVGVGIKIKKEYKMKSQRIQSTAIVTQFSKSRDVFIVTLKSGEQIEGWCLPKNIEIGDLVKVQAIYSVMNDCYLVEDIRKATAK